MYMEESFDLDKLTELSAKSEKSLKQEPNSPQFFYPTDSQQFYEDETKKS